MQGPSNLAMDHRLMSGRSVRLEQHRLLCLASCKQVGMVLNAMFLHDSACTDGRCRLDSLEGTMQHGMNRLQRSAG